MKSCVFLGPTLPLDQVPTEIDAFGPAALGSVYRAVEEGYTHIGIIDGVFGAVPSVWHKEILYAIENGVAICGASSIGALRAAELHPYGMQGTGWIYRMFRAGALTDDDEVAVIHGPADVAWSPLSEPMVNIRYTLMRLRRAGLLSREDSARVGTRLKALFYPERTREALIGSLQERVPRGDWEAALAQHYFDVKADDARKLLERMNGTAATAPEDRLWQFPSTRYWASQFHASLDDVPGLQPRLRTGGTSTSKSATRPSAAGHAPEG